MVDDWRDIPGYEGVYQVTSDGRVKRLAGSTKCKRDRILRPGVSRGYYSVSLCVSGKPKHAEIHQLVLLTFVGPSNGLWVNHKNGIKKDNRLENLEYSTPSENTKHAYDTGLRGKNYGEKNGLAKLTAQQVIEIRSLIDQGYTHKQISPIYGVGCTTISNIRTGLCWSTVE